MINKTFTIKFFVFLLFVLIFNIEKAKGQTTKRDTLYKNQRTNPIWPYKGYIGFNPIYTTMGMHQILILGGGIEGELSLPKLISFRTSLSHNYYEVDRSVWKKVPWINAEKVKKGYVYDFGISFHPIEWTEGGKYGYTKATGEYKKERVTVREYYDVNKYRTYTFDRTVPVMARYYDDDVFTKRICFRGGLMRYSYAQENKNLNYPSSFYVWDTYINASYLGLSYYKVGLGKGYRVQYFADLVFKNSIETPLIPAIADTSVSLTGMRMGFVKASSFGGGTYELGFLPGINKLVYYMKITLTFNITFVNNENGIIDRKKK